MILDLVPHDDPILRQECPKFDFTTPPIDPIELVVNLAETMMHLGGLGLAAPQVGLPYNCFVLYANPIIAVYNPILIDATTEQTELEEGCLSFPNLVLKIARPSVIKVRYQMPNSETITQKYVGMTSRAFQHEMHHLHGILFTDHVSKLKLQMAKAKAKKGN